MYLVDNVFKCAFLNADTWKHACDSFIDITKVGFRCVCILTINACLKFVNVKMKSNRKMCIADDVENQLKTRGRRLVIVLVAVLRLDESVAD